MSATEQTVRGPVQTNQPPDPPEPPPLITMVAVVALVVAFVILVFSGLGYLLGKFIF